MVQHGSHERPLRNEQDEQEAARDRACTVYALIQEDMEM